MLSGPLDPTHRALLEARHLRPPFPQEAAQELLGVLEQVQLQAGETLLRQNDPGDAMYLVLNGRVSVRVEHADGTTSGVDEVGPGGVVGELALVTGQPRNATVVALESTEAARLARTDFDRLSERHPEALNTFMRRVLPRLRRTQLIHVLNALFGELDASALQDLEAALEWVEVAGGQTLFHQGDRSDDLYIVVNGRLRITVQNGDLAGEGRVLEEPGPGMAVGEIALLTREPRAATITAVRDSDLLRLRREAFDALLERHPRAMMQIVRAAATRLRQTALNLRREPGPTTYVLVAASPGVPLGDLAGRLCEALEPAGRALALASADVDRLLGRPGIAQSASEGVIHEALVSWISTQERTHRHLVLIADDGDSPWTRRCMRHADRVVLVARADAAPACSSLESLPARMRINARTELVLIHRDETARPEQTHAWLAGRTLARHHHVRLGNAADVRKLARRLSGRAIGLVLGGGGARGFAHIGALRAFSEAGIEFDLVGGSSIGSVIAGAFALGLSARDMESLAQTFASRKAILDRTLPIVALMEGRKVTALYQRVYGEAMIEDLWTPFFAVSSGLSRAEAVVHTRGPLWRAARASTAVPAIFPPILDDDSEVLVDGNVMNNMPLDVMRGWCESGTVIGINPMPTHTKERSYNFGASVSGWEALKSRLRFPGAKTRAPSLFGAVMRATELNSASRMRQPAFRAHADLLIEPPVADFPIMEYGEYAKIIEVGYEATRDAIAGWRADGSRTAA
jgi:NTE family protein/lysophospholipid hydrolase